MASNVLLWLAVLTLLIAANPAAASWLPRSFLKGFTPHPTPTSSHASYLTAQNHSTMSVDPLSLSAGSYLSALDQCGGTGGFCNRTTIGVPCGDRQWPGSYCPEDYECIRSNSSYWQCTLMPGRTPADNPVATLEIGTNRSLDNSRVPVDQTLTIATMGTGRQDEAISTGSSSRYNRNRSTVSDTGVTVPVCGPAHFAGRHVAMCNSTMDGFFVNSTQVAGINSAGYGQDKCTSLLMLAAAIAALFAAHAVS